MENKNVTPAELHVLGFKLVSSTTLTDKWMHKDLVVSLVGTSVYVGLNSVTRGYTKFPGAKTAEHISNIRTYLYPKS